MAELDKQDIKELIEEIKNIEEKNKQSAMETYGEKSQIPGSGGNPVLDISHPVYEGGEWHYWDQEGMSPLGRREGDFPNEGDDYEGEEETLSPREEEHDNGNGEERVNNDESFGEKEEKNPPAVGAADKKDSAEADGSQD